MTRANRRHRPMQTVLAPSLLLAAAFLPPGAHAQDITPAAITADTDESEIERIARELVMIGNARCLSCHVGDSGHAQEGGLLFGVPASDNGTPRHSPGFMASNHGEMACTTCHVGAFRDYPHQAAPTRMPAATLECSECHVRRTHTIDAEIAQSVHADQVGDAFTCTTCHDPHLMLSGPRVSDPLELVKQDNTACLSCHASDTNFAVAAAGVTPPIERPDIDAIHAWLPNRERHWDAVRCVDCHTPAADPGALLGVSHQIMGADGARRDCATCHTVDSVLSTTLYRHLRSMDVSLNGFQNSAIAETSYVIGSTRNATLDLLGILSILAVLAGVLGHGALRWLAAQARKGKRT